LWVWKCDMCFPVEEDILGHTEARRSRVASDGVVAVQPP